MPIYEFRCQKCGHLFEKLCTMGENGETLACPKCKTQKPRRVMSAFKAKSKGNEGGEDNLNTGSSSACAGCSATNCSSCGL